MRRQFKVLATNQEFVSHLISGASRSRPAHAKAITRLLPALGTAVATCAALVAVAGPAGAVGPPAFLSRFDTVTTVSTTVPPVIGDVNPYGIVNVPQSIGLLVRGDTLVSNFNASSNLQGTGTTIVEISRSHQQTLFAHINPYNLPGPCPGVSG